MEKVFTKKECYSGNKILLIKNIVLLGLESYILLLFLFGSIIIKANTVLDIYVKVSGFNIIKSLLSNNNYIVNNIELGELTVNIPALPALLFLGFLLLICACIVFTIISAVKKKDIMPSRILSLVSAVYLAIVYFVLIAPIKVVTQDFFGKDCLFYQAFSIKETVLILVVLLALAFIIKKGVNLKNFELVKRFMPFYVMAIIPLALILIFSVYPVLLQIVMSFKDYKLATGVWGSAWNGLDNFAEIFKDADIVMVLLNTVLVSFLKIAVSIICPLILAILIFDIASGIVRKSVQTIIYLPHFFSWVVIYGITYAFINNEGIINILLQKMGLEQIGFLTSEKLFLPIQLVTFGWKEIGWGTIIYFAALMGIDTSMFEAAKVDGAGPIKRLVHITIPSIMPVVIFTTILALGNILKTAGGEQMLLFYNLAVEKQALVIDTWLYYKGLNELEYGIGSAMLFFQSFVGIIFVLASNWMSKKFTDRAIW